MAVAVAMAVAAPSQVLTNAYSGGAGWLVGSCGFHADDGKLFVRNVTDSTAGAAFGPLCGTGDRVRRRCTGSGAYSAPTNLKLTAGCMHVLWGLCV